jgi:hypothetical protein
MVIEFCSEDFFNSCKSWGLATQVDIKNCHEVIITSSQAIHDFVQGLCRTIKMNPYGKLLIYDFGKTPDIAGYSFCQMIETSSITGHLPVLSRSVFLDIFSCKWYDQRLAAKYSVQFFNGELCNLEVSLRTGI